MKLNQFTDIGLRVLMYLGRRPEDPAATISELAEKFEISRNHLVKVVQFLSNHQIIKAQRGRGGGLILARPAEEIKIGQLVLLLEQFDCVIDCETRSCYLKGNCLLKGVLNGAFKVFIKYLDNYSIKDVTSGKTEILLKELITKE